MTRAAVAELEELWEGEMRACRAGRHRILLLRLEDGIYAYEDRCAHLGMPLSEGKLRDGVLVCSAHHFEYDARTGRGINPRNLCLRRFPVVIENGKVWVVV